MIKVVSPSFWASIYCYVLPDCLVNHLSLCRIRVSDQAFPVKSSPSVWADNYCYFVPYHCQCARSDRDRQVHSFFGTTRRILSFGAARYIAHLQWRVQF